MATNSADPQATNAVAAYEKHDEDQTSTLTCADSQDALPVPCAMFSCFPKLPIELRNKIWKYASFETRNICVTVKRLAEITLFDSDTENEDLDDDELPAIREELSPYFYDTACPHPAILHTCHESRTEGLRYYMLDFGANEKSSRLSFQFSSAAKTYINWQADRVCVVTPTDFNYYGNSPCLEHFVNLCKERKLQLIAINLCHVLSTLRSILDCQIEFREVVFFLACPRTIKCQVIKKKTAFLEFTEGIPLPPPRENATSWELGEYDNGGDIQWGKSGNIYYLYAAKLSLLEVYEKHEKKIAKKNSKGAEASGAEIPTWSRPEINFCTVQLKLFPKATNDADTTIQCNGKAF